MIKVICFARDPGPGSRCIIIYRGWNRAATSGVTIGPADPALQGGAVSGGRQIARKCGTFFGKLNCSTSKSTRFRLEMHIFIRFLPPFSLFCWDLILKERGAKWATGAPAGGRPYSTLRHWE